MENFQALEHEHYGKIRMFTDNNEAWYFASDILSPLELGNITKTLKHVSESHKKLVRQNNVSGVRISGRGVWLINNDGLHEMALVSKADVAEGFTKWLSSTPLPDPTGIQKLNATEISDEQDTTLTEKFAEENSSKIQIAETPTVTINDSDISVKEYNGRRVVTLKDIDLCHSRPDGTAGRNFRTNKHYLVEREDYFRVCPDEIRRHKIMQISPKTREDIILLTESGYLMLVKSFTDDLAWQVQRQLVNTYFKKEPTMTAASIKDILLNPEGLITVLTALQEEQQKVKLLSAENKQLSVTNDLLAKKHGEWDCRAIINRLVRSYATNQNGCDFQTAYTHFYTNINYKLHISLWSRRSRDSKAKQRSLIDYLTEDELRSAAGVAIQMCREVGLNVENLIGEVNTKRIERNV